MNRENIYFLLSGLFIGIFIVGGIIALFQPIPKMQESEKMEECIKEGGQFSIYDWSLRDDGSDYRVTCEIPEYRLWQINY